MSDGFAPSPQPSSIGAGPALSPSPASGRGRGEGGGRGGERDAQTDRIAWRCRRGLLELDLLLGGFWTAHRATLEPDETAALERLLALPDMEIVDRIEGRAPAGDAALTALVERLKNFRETAG